MGVRTPSLTPCAQTGLLVLTWMGKRAAAPWTPLRGRGAPSAGAQGPLVVLGPGQEGETHFSCELARGHRWDPHHCKWAAKLEALAEPSSACFVRFLALSRGPSL